MDADYLIAGAGCAGLSFAVHLLERGPPGQRIVLLDPRHDYTGDRTWCFWKVVGHPFEHCVTRMWTQWRVQDTSTHVVRSSERYPYHHLPADAFYQEALMRVERSEHVELHRGVSVHHIEDRQDSVRVHTDEGVLSARMAFDARPPKLDAPPEKGETRLWQHFMGWRVRTELPIFDTHVVTLMDFRVDQRNGLHFVYVLPFGPYEALVEDTYFSPQPLGSETYEQTLHDYLDVRLQGARYERLGHETGMLPMTTESFPTRTSRNVYRLGLGAGLAKPSTGYAFVAIQRFSAALARRLRQAHPQSPPSPRPRTVRATTLDRVFLSWLGRHPDRAPHVFVQLFTHTPAEALVRFLSETEGPADTLAVMRALPPSDFGLEAVRSLPVWLRGRA